MRVPAWALCLAVGLTALCLLPESEAAGPSRKPRHGSVCGFRCAIPELLWKGSKKMFRQRGAVVFLECAVTAVGELLELELLDRGGTDLSIAGSRVQPSRNTSNAGKKKKTVRRVCGFVSWHCRRSLVCVRFYGFSLPCLPVLLRRGTETLVFCFFPLPMGELSCKTGCSNLLVPPCL